MEWGGPRMKREVQGNQRAVLEDLGSRGLEGNQEERELPASLPRPGMDAERSLDKGKNQGGVNRPSDGNRGLDPPSVHRIHPLDPSDLGNSGPSR